ncbi:MAG: hypothetical protein E6J14_12155 [Chloroflexi bacterium]|nr:MAG: hypothetical protein E6J14_12155 [Chloroflexota bacterium]
MRRASAWRRLGWAGAAVAVAVAMGPALPDLPRTDPPQVGFSFSPVAAGYAGLDPNAALSELLRRLRPDVVRLPVYWSDVAPAPHHFAFGEVDGMLTLVAAHNAQPGQRPTHVVLVVGARNLGFPEVYLPEWIPPEKALSVAALVRGPDYAEYLTASVRRYAHNPLLQAWQVENEPLDDVASGQPVNVAMPVAQVRAEVDSVHLLDPHHPVAVTTYNSAHVDLDAVGSSRFGEVFAHLPGPQPVGHPLSALEVSDVLGLDVYVITGNTSALADVPAARRIGWKHDILDYWSQRALAQGKQLWVTELQAAPWPGTDGFTPDDLLLSASQYADSSANLVLLWGVESWVRDPRWWNAGVAAVRILRGHDPQDAQRAIWSF